MQENMLYTIMILYFGQGQLTGKRKRSDGDEHMESRRKIARVINSPLCETGEGCELPVCGSCLLD